jgi:predicted secreted protein|tara:strand:+ start:615 stop:887 length:273 start_codon:yes stop_codon:yes gene_type:complete
LGIAGSIILFLLIWWLLLFTILPLNISNNAEKNINNDGNDSGAPNNPQIFKKFLITTILSTIIWSIIYLFLKDQGLLLYILDLFYSNEVN